MSCKKRYKGGFMDIDFNDFFNRMHATLSNLSWNPNVSSSSSSSSSIDDIMAQYDGEPLEDRKSVV